VKGLYNANEEEEDAVFDVNCITPGTPFMKTLSESIKYYIAHRISCNPSWKNIKVVFSDSSVPGEGEHKIMDFIRNQRKHAGYDPNTRHVIYGLDADLIMLSLATHEPHFYVLREDVFYSNKRNDQCYKCGATGHFAVDCILPESAVDQKIKPFVFLSIPILREYLSIEFQQQQNSSDYDFERLIDDWIFLIFFVGNDFLPHLPSLEIREGAIDMLVGIYKRKFMSLGGYLTRDGKINFNRAILILSELGDMEESIFQRRQERETRRLQNASMRMQREKGIEAAVKVNDVAADGGDSKLPAAENVKVGLKRPLDEAEDIDPIRFHEEGFKRRYYESKFGEKHDAAFAVKYLFT
jgi:5'-3' exoribonuclease 2